MSIARVGLIVAVVLLAGAVVIAARAAHVIKVEMYVPHAPLTVAEQAEATRALPGKMDVTLHAVDGFVIRGWYAPSKTGAAVILGHGVGNNRASMLPEAEALVARGYGVLLFDWRGAGESDGDHVTWGDQERRDLTAALDWLAARPDVDAHRIGVLGFSIGGTTAALLAPTDPRERALVLEATSTSLRSQIAIEGRWGPLTHGAAAWALAHEGVDIDAVDPPRALRSAAPRPLLIVAGGADPYVPAWMTEEVFAAAREPKQLYVIPGAGHGDYASVAGAAYAKRIADFFDDALRAP